MRGHEFFELKRQIQSLSDSTRVAIAHQGVAVKIYGRNSPYISHVRFCFSSPAEIVSKVGGIWLGNDVATLVISPDHPTCLPEFSAVRRGGKLVKAELMEAWVPGFLISPLLSAAIEALGEIWKGDRYNRLVKVAFYVPTVTGWTDEGDPVFEETGENNLPVIWFEDEEAIFREVQVDQD